MPEAVNIDTKNIRRVLLKDHGWITVEPGSIVIAPLQFWYPPESEGGDRIYSGVSYLGYSFVEAETGKKFSAITESITACEVGGE